MSRRLHTVSWIAGLALLATIIWYFKPADFLPTLRRVGFSGAFGWFMATMVARMLSADVLARILDTLGCMTGRMKLFAIGWLRTFSNQVVPMTGIAVYLQQLKRSTAASWQDITAASLQQTFVNVLALGIAGTAAVIANRAALDEATYPLLTVFVVLAVLGMAAASGASSALRMLPGFLRRRVAEAADSFTRLAQDRPFTIQLAGIQVGSMLMRVARMWLLFGIMGMVLEWEQALLIVVLADISMLVAITPGGLGIREAIIIGGASLLGLPMEIAVSVSLMDRLFAIVTAGAASLPSAAYLARQSGRHTS